MPSSAGRLTGYAVELVREELGRSSPAPPDVLSHYTTPEGLLGILQTSCLFLSDARFVNDRSEISFGRRVFTERFRHFVEARAHPRAESVWDMFTGSVEHCMSTPATGGWPRSPEHFYLASFCTNGNLLSQWRAYGVGGGCSLGFRSSELISGAAIIGEDGTTAYTMAYGGIRLQEVLYDEARQNALIDRILGVVFSLLYEPLDDLSDHYLANTLDLAVIPMVAACIKAPVFQEEQEWRLVCSSKFAAGLRFRLQRGKIVPYLRCSLKSAKDTASQPRLPISTIYIGPSDAAELLHLSVVELLQQRGLINDNVIPDDSVRVIQSSIPLRSS